MSNHKQWIFTNTLTWTNGGKKVPLPPSECVQAAHTTNVALRVVQPLTCCSTCEHSGAGGSIHLAELWPFSFNSPPHQSTEMAGCRGRSRLKDLWLRRKQQDWDVDATYLGWVSLHTPLVKVKRLTLST